MIRLSFKRMTSRKLFSFVLILALISIMVLIPMGVQHARESTLAVGNSIAEHGRGTYDILVRPGGARTSIENEMGMVEENYIGDSMGGISIEEWRKIQQDADIEVAAPVASIGYFTGKNFSVELPKPKEPTNMTWQFFTSDGTKDYPIGKPQNTVFIEEAADGLLQYLKSNTREGAIGTAIHTMMPPAHYHIAAVDLESEQQLTNIDLSQLNKEVPLSDRGHLNRIFNDAPIIKVIQRQDIGVPMKMKVTMETLDIELSEIQKKLGLTEKDWVMSVEDQPREQVMKELLTLEPLSVSEYEIDLTPYQKPFDGTALKLSEEFEVLPAEGFSYGQVETPVYYTADKIEYQSINGQLQVDAVEDGQPPSYKKIQKHGKRQHEADEYPFILEQVGTFDTSNVKESLLTSSPLGIYSTEKVTTKNGQVLKPTTAPGSFIPQPAGGLISIEEAELIKGSKPIDAIRVKVSGITTYNKEAQEKMEFVATRLLQEGYEVDIVAGSSFKQVNLDVEGIGLVESPWTTLGVAQSLEEGWNSIAFTTTILFISFAAVWFIVRLQFEHNALRAENELLALIGWRKKRIVQRNVLEQFILIGIAYIFSLVLISFLQLEKQAYTLCTVILVLFFLLVWFLFSKKQVATKQLIANRRLQSLYYYRHIIVPTMVVLIISIVLFTIQVSSIGHTVLQAQTTSLGQYIVDQTLWFQVSILLSTIILTVFALGECLNALLSIRKDEFEMYYVIGWSKKEIMKHFLKEILKWAGLAIGVGMLVSLFATIALGFLTLWIMAGIILSGLIWGLLIYCLVLVRKTVFIPEQKSTEKSFRIKGFAFGGVLLIMGFLIVLNWSASSELNREKVIIPVSNKSESYELEKLPIEISPVSGAHGDYALDVKMDESGEFQIKGDIKVTNQSQNEWKDIGFYFIPNALTEVNKPKGMISAAQYKIDAVESSGRSMPYELENNRLLIALQEGLAPGKSIDINFEYTLTLPKNGFRLSTTNGSYHLAQWYPMLGYYSDRWSIEDYAPEGESYNTGYGSYKVTYHLPKEYLIVSSGMEDPLNPSSSGEIKVEQIKDFYLAFLDPDEWTMQTQYTAGTTIRSFLTKGEEDLSPQLLQVAAETFEYFDEKIGENPFRELDIIGNRNQMEYPNVVEVTPELEYVVVHEIAHQWFYHLTSNDPFHDAWIDEGLTQLATSLYLTEKYQDSNIGFESTKRFYKGGDSFSEIANLPITSFASTNEYISTIYGKVPLVLYEFFEQNGGEEEAIRFLSEYFKEFQFQSVDSKSFSLFFIEQYGEESQSFLKEWLSI